MLWKRIAVASLVGGALVAMPSEGAAQYLWDNICGTTSGLTACASTEVWWNSSTKSLQMKVWNLDDGPGGTSTVPSTITKVGLTPTDNENSLADGEYPTFGSFSVFGWNRAGIWTDFSSYYAKGAKALQINLAVATSGTGGDSKNGGLNGCTDLASPSAVYMYSCGAEKYALFTFNDVLLPAGYPDLEAYYFEFHAQQLDGGGPSVKGHGGPPTHVTPEPVSTILLGSGLLGLGYVRRRRRKDLSDA